jgi:hypothetical protein
LRREMREEACATVIGARLLGYTRGACLEGHDAGRVLVRSIWRADVALEPWQPTFEMRQRRCVRPTSVITTIGITTNPFGPFVRRALHEADIPGLV